MKKIAIIRESRTDDNRTPLAPIHIKELSIKFPNITITVQPSRHRCFLDREQVYIHPAMNQSIRIHTSMMEIRLHQN